MSPLEHPFKNIPSLNETQNNWANELLQSQAKLLELLAKENLLPKPKKNPKDDFLPHLSFDTFEVMDWNKYKKLQHWSFTDMIDMSTELHSRTSQEIVLQIIQKIHFLRLNLIHSFLPLIQFIARKYAHNHYSLFADLTSEGYLGLLKCLDSFYYVDPSSSIKSYAIFYIKQEMRRYLLENQKGYRIPYIAKIKQIQNSNPQALEISAVQYFSDIRGDSSSDSYENNIPSSVKTPYEEAWNRSLKKILSQTLETLPQNERTILTLRYGLDERKMGDKKSSLRQIGETLSLSQERIRQLEKKALERLHKIVEGILKKDDLGEY